MKKRFFLAAMTLLVSMGAFAQGNGIAGISEATNMVTSYFDPGTKLIYAIGAVIGFSPQRQLLGIGPEFRQ